MLSYRFAALSFALAASASTSAFAGAGTLVATVTPLSSEVTYSDGVTPTSMKTYAGYSVLFANNSSNTINDVHFRVSLVAGVSPAGYANAANMTLVPGYLPLPACVQVTADTTTFECTIPQMKSQDRFPSDGKPFIDPVFVYRTFRGNKEGVQSFGTAITGGYVYRGKLFPQLVGKYVFGDWSRNMGLGDGTLLLATRPNERGTGEKWTAEPLPLKDHPDGRIKAFLWALGEDEEGELYVLTNGANLVTGTRGKVFKLVPM